MTWKHALVICFVFLVVAICGMSTVCQANTSKLGDLALVAIGAVSGNAMNEMRHTAKPKRKKGNAK